MHAILFFCLSRAEDGYDQLFDPQKDFMSIRPLYQAYEDRNVSECFFFQSSGVK